MELTTMQMYLIMKLDDIQSFLIAACVLSVVAFYEGMTIRLDAERCCENKKQRMLTKSAKIIRRSIVALLSALAVMFVLPSTKQMAAIMIIPKIANSEKVEKIGNGLYDLAVEWMNELKPTKKEGAK